MPSTIQNTPRPTNPINPGTYEYFCPNPTESISINIYGTLKFYLSKPSQLCTLIQVAEDKKSFKPVGRSYDGRKWEATSGAFSSLPWTCNEISCDVILPTLPDQSMYQLISLDTTAAAKHGSKDEIARFLEQATFGPTLEAIERMHGHPNAAIAFAKWIQEQQDEVPLTSHREVFRKRMNARTDTASFTFGVTHPCQNGTRYRRYPFSVKDWEKYMDIETVGNKKILKIDGFVRTVVNGPIYNPWDPSSVWPDGSFQIATNDYMDEIGGAMRLSTPGDKGHSSVSFGDRHGNPEIRFDSSIGANPSILINLLDTDAASIDDRFFLNAQLKTQEIILTRNLSYSLCGKLGLPGKVNTPVFAFYKGDYWIHDPRYESFINTVDSPSPDGGGKALRETYNIVHNDRSMICSNAPRSFLNEEGCKLSNEPTACAAHNSDPNNESNRPDFFVKVNAETIRGIYAFTGGGKEGTKYLYAADGLRMNDNNAIGYPCEQITSRWVPIKCTGAASSLDKTLHEIFSMLLFYSDDRNELVRDVWNWWPVQCPAPLYQYRGFEVKDQDGKKCWKHVHPNYLSVYDMTIWTRLDSHPGNSEKRNPIKEFAANGFTTLKFPDWHNMNYWEDNYANFGYVGRLGDIVHYYSLPMSLRSEKLNEYFGFTSEDIKYEDSNGIVVCGSPNEVANDLRLGGSQDRGAFDAITNIYGTTDSGDIAQQKSIIWTHIALTAQDQLRQRMAWAISQIIAVSPKFLYDGDTMTEAMTTFYDIFVRNAFGNYRNILKEVSYSSVMAEMLTFLGSRSTAYTWLTYGNVEYADENYAREIMQLFSIGLFRLRMDGTPITNENGDPIHTYSNDDIVEYARAWTGFESSPLRGNIEYAKYGNRIDQMRIHIAFRDAFPKMGLNRIYIGEGKPLCADLPNKHFLKFGATYRLLGRNSSTDLLNDPIEWSRDPKAKRVTLKNNGGVCLYSVLCGAPDNTGCRFKAKVVLNQNLPCVGIECTLDNMRVVEVDGVFYEYIRPPCVYQAYFQNAKTIIPHTSWRELMCADPRTQIATAACCNSDAQSGTWNYQYWGERITFAQASQRCDAQYCDRSLRPECSTDVDPSLGAYCSGMQYFWTGTSCTLRAKIYRDGTIGIVHSPNGIDTDAVHGLVNGDTKTFFRVDWSTESDDKSITSRCNQISTCQTLKDNTCVCDVLVKESQVFFSESEPRNKEDVLSSLRIGAFDPLSIRSDWVKKSVNGINIYTIDGKLTSESIFELTDGNGVHHLRKNVVSVVQIVGTNASFRNPVHFVSLSDAETYQAQDETDAAIDHYFYHSNTAPFLALRLAQRFGISNPSPGYIFCIASAFKSGYVAFTEGSSSFTFGSGKYGDLSATVACILLDQEARTTILDADPMHGSFKEPMLKFIGLMKALQFKLSNDAGFVDFDASLIHKIGQMPHALPNVFSFFHPEYQPSGPITMASLVAPESQVMTGPRIIDFLNGMLSLVRYGLTYCYGGFGRYKYWRSTDCSEYRILGENKRNMGKLSYSPTADISSESLVNELSMLMTAGRLSTSNRQVISEIVSSEPNQSLGLIKAQQLMILSPEFHVTNLVRKSGALRPNLVSQKPSNQPYKAIVYVMLDGGMDSFNLLVPHTCTKRNSNGKTLLEQYYSERTTLALTEEEQSRVIDSTGQPCSQFVIHQNLEIVERLYKNRDLLFFANAGVLNQPVKKENYIPLTKTILFGHNTMVEEAQKVDPYNSAPGTGILGRMCDRLRGKGFNVQPITIQDASVATVGSPGAAVDPLLISPFQTTKFNPASEDDKFKIEQYVGQLNDATVQQSSLYGETWSKFLQKAVFDNESILKTLSTAQLQTVFPETEFSLQLRVVTTLITSYKQRGTDRDVFFVKLSGWDQHSAMKSNLAANFALLNEALTAFHDEMKAKGLWKHVSLLVTSEFSRTLTANSSDGTDHGWGGHYFLMGGAVNGGRILGSYPDDITPIGDLAVGRGSILPTLSWESILNPVVQWMGAESESDLDYAMPNRKKTGAKLFNANEVFDAESRIFWE